MKDTRSINGKKIGRPRCFDTPFDLADAIQEYFEKQDNATDQKVSAGKVVVINSPRPYAKAGLCAHLGFTRDTWSRLRKDETVFEDGEGEKLRFSDVIKCADVMVEASWEGALFSKDTCRGAQFALNCHYNWIEKQDMNINGSMAVTAMSDEELNANLAMMLSNAVGDPANDEEKQED